MSAAEKIEIAAPVTPRRFSVGDLTEHGPWLMPRLVKAYPHLNEHVVAGWLRSFIDSREHLFLYLPHAVGMAQLINTYSLNGKPVVVERFVWAQNRANPAHLDQAVSLYTDMAAWAKGLGVSILVFGDSSDVPRERINDKFGRIYQRTEQYVRL